MIDTRIQLKRIYILGAIGALLFGVLLLRSDRVPPHVTAGEMQIPVTIADSPAQRERGLSGTESLSKGTGKLFIFERPGTYGFWMKDMQYPIDIVWIDAGWKVVGVAAQVLPESYPEMVYPPSEVLYVLELNAGEASGDNFKPGALLDFKK
jgi:uncharacterized membrane protein (UPF0127 family)